MLAALLITLYEARLAQRRFNDIRRLANSMIFEVHDSIAKVPGTTAARKVIAQRSLDYLDSLSQDAGHDRSLFTHELGTRGESTVCAATALDSLAVSFGQPWHCLRYPEPPSLNSCISIPTAGCVRA